MPTHSPLPSQAQKIPTISREAFWRHHIDQWRESGLSKRNYCEQNSVVYHQMVYWCSKDDKANEKVVPPSTGLVAVSVAPVLNTPGLSVQLPNGMSINGIDQLSVALVGKLIEQL